MKQLNPTLVKIVNILNDGEYHDGTTIGNLLGISRNAVWKTIKRLESYGVKVNSHKAQGYALSEPLILLDQKTIKQELQHKNLDIEIFETIKSTNSYLKTCDSNQTIKICLAEQQTQGKGRFNRDWHSPFGQNIYLSCLYPFKKDLSELGGLSLAVSLAVLKSIQMEQQDAKIALKWPNDIIYDAKKIAGCLIEVSAEAHNRSDAIIGIGINANMLQDNSNIPQPWASLRQISGHYVDRNILATNLINTLLKYLDKFATYGLEPFLAEWNQYNQLLGKKISLKHGNAETQGTVIGINNHGHLLLELADGSVQAFSSGDTTILK